MIHHMPLRQLFRHILYADARVCHQNHGMVTQVCQLVDRFVLVFLRCRDDNLGTLLADLFQNLVQTFVGAAAMVDVDDTLDLDEDEEHTDSEADEDKDENADEVRRLNEFDDGSLSDGDIPEEDL